MTQKFDFFFNKLKTLYKTHNREFKLQKPATLEKIQEAEALISKKFDDSYKDFLLITNGSEYYDNWGVVYSDEYIPISFNSIEASIEDYMIFSYDKDFYKEWSITKKYQHFLKKELDKRIKSFLHHKYWFPIADFSGSATVYYDMDPTEAGDYGQIIVYQHDPDFVYYIAPNFISFLEDTVKLLENNPNYIS